MFLRINNAIRAWIMRGLHYLLLARAASRCRRAYILLLCFFFLSSFRHLSSEVTELIWTKLGHIFTYECYLKNLVRTPPGIYPLRAGAKTAFLGTDFELWQNISLQRNMISRTGMKLINLQGLPYMHSKFAELWSKNGWERLASFCPPSKFSHWETLPALLHGRYITDSRQTLARVM